MIKNLADTGLSTLGEFKKFISRGSVVDLAVGVIIGASFGKIVSSFVADIIMPPIGLLLGGVNFSGLKVVLGGKPEAPATLNYGNFVQATIDFLIIAFAIFWVVKLFQKFKAKEEAKAPSPEVALLTEIRDLLKK